MVNEMAAFRIDEPILRVTHVKCLHCKLILIVFIRIFFEYIFSQPVKITIQCEYALFIVWKVFENLFFSSIFGLLIER